MQTFRALKEFHLRQIEQLYVDKQIQMQQSILQNQDNVEAIFPTFQQHVSRPLDCHFEFNPIYKQPLPKNQTSMVGFLEQLKLQYD